MKRATIPFVLALLTVPTCASLPEGGAVACIVSVKPPPGTYYRSSARALPPIPAYVPSFIDSVPVRLVRDLRCNGMKVVGCFTFATRTIELEDSLSHFNRWLVLRHEIFHSAMWDAGLRFKHGPTEDVIADVIARQQMIEMERGWPP
jgi:hypothetical protein